MHVLCLSASDVRLLAARFAEHENSYRRMRSALEEAGSVDEAERLRALRRLEHRFQVDLASLCHRFLRRDDLATHPLERLVLNWVAEWRSAPEGQDALWVLLDRVRQVRELVEQGQLVSDPP